MYRDAGMGKVKEWNIKVSGTNLCKYPVKIDLAPSLRISYTMRIDRILDIFRRRMKKWN